MFAKVYIKDKIPKISKNFLSKSDERGYINYQRSRYSINRFITIVYHGISDIRKLDLYCRRYQNTKQIGLAFWHTG